MPDLDDDDALIRDFIARWMKENNFDVPANATPEELLAAIAGQAGWEG